MATHTKCFYVGGNMQANGTVYTAQRRNDTSWTVGKSYDFNLYFHCVLPMGKQTIMVESINEQTREIQSREYNTLVPVWNHLIKMQPVNNNQVQYTDEIDVYAGILTSFVAWWSCRFYQHRQRKWQTILRK